MPEDWPFDDPEDVAAYTLKRIVRGESPIRFVSHDADDGAWQFLDGLDASVEDAALVCLREMARIDPSLLELAELPLGWVAERERPGEPWSKAPAVTEADRDRKLASDVEEFGWHVALIPEDEEGPAFAFSIGLFRKFGHPEVVVFGLGIEAMHEIVNLIGEEVRRGRRFSGGRKCLGDHRGIRCQILRGRPDSLRRVPRDRNVVLRWGGLPGLAVPLARRAGSIPSRRRLSRAAAVMPAAPRSTGCNLTRHHWGTHSQHFRQPVPLLRPREVSRPSEFCMSWWTMSAGRTCPTRCCSTRSCHEEDAQGPGDDRAGRLADPLRPADGPRSSG